MAKRHDDPAQAEAQRDVPVLVGYPDLRRIFGVPYSRPTIWRMRRAGTFPAPVRVVPGRTVWRSADILKWVQGESQTPVAFVSVPVQSTSPRPRGPIKETGPVSLRDTFAIQALSTLGGHKAVTARGIPWLVEHAYMVADAMLDEREKPAKAWRVP